MNHMRMKEKDKKKKRERGFLRGKEGSPSKKISAFRLSKSGEE